MSIYHLRIIERLWGSRKFAVSLLCLAGTHTYINVLLVIPDQHSSSYSSPPANFNDHPSAPLFQCNQPPSRWSNTPHLRRPGSVPCCHSYSLQVPYRYL